MFTRPPLGPTLALAIAALSVPWLRTPETSAQPVVPVGSEMQVNAFTTGSQLLARLVADEAGGFVVVWASQGVDGDGRGISGRRLDSTGAPTGAEFAVNEFTTGSQGSPAVAADGLGGFVVTWRNYTATPGDPTDSIQARAFDSANVPFSGDVQVNTTTDGNQVAPAIANLPTAGFVVAWQDPSGIDIDVRARAFDVAGVPVGADFVVNTQTTENQREPHIGSDGSDGLVVVWTGQQTDGGDADRPGVLMRQLDSVGQPLGQDFQVNSYTTGDQYVSHVGPDGQGGFVVSWYSEPLDGDVTEYDIVARRFQSDGTPRGPDFTVSDYDSPEAVQSFDARTAPDGTGGFVVVWGAEFSASDFIVGRRVDASGQPVGEQIQLSSSAATSPRRPSVATLAEGDFVVVWDSDVSAGTDTDTGSIQARRFALDHDEDGIGTPVDTCTDIDGDGFGNPGFPANTCPEDNCPEIPNGNQIDIDGDGIGVECDECLGTNTTGDDDGDGVCNDLDVCLGNDFTGDADGDGLCADRDCDDNDATNACAVFSDGFESGDTLAWSASVP